jgi:osmotically-inducible protein OsmY
VAAANLAGLGPKGYRRADTRIREDVAEEMAAHPDLDPSELEVDVLDGVVHLRGTVVSRRQKWLAEDCCTRVAGVADVQDDLRVVRRR